MKPKSNVWKYGIVFACVLVVVVLSFGCLQKVTEKENETTSGAIPITGWYFSVDGSNYFIIDQPKEMTGQIFKLSTNTTPSVQSLVIGTPKISLNEAKINAHTYLNSKNVITYFKSFGIATSLSLGEPLLLHFANGNCSWRFPILTDSEQVGIMGISGEDGSFQHMRYTKVLVQIDKTQAQQVLQNTLNKPITSEGKYATFAINSTGGRI